MKGSVSEYTANNEPIQFSVNVIPPTYILYIFCQKKCYTIAEHNES